jgi:hypothetical protein
MTRIARPVLLAFVLAIALPAAAETKGEVEARGLFREGNRRFDAADYVAALDLFRAAYARFPSPKILLNIGTTLKQLGRFAEATDSYEQYRRHPAADPKRRAEVDQIVKELAIKVGRLRVTVNEPGARVLVDGKAVGESPQQISVRLDAGDHSIMAEKDGFPMAATRIALAGGEERTVELRLVRAASPERGQPKPAPTPAPTVADATPTAPPVAVTPIAGPRPRDEAWRPPPYVAWIALGVAAVAAGTGGYFGSRVLDRGVSVDDSKRPALSATVCFSIAGVAAAAAGGALLWRALAPRKARTLEAGLGPGVLVLAGRF